MPFLFFFNDTATTEIYTLSLHDALPISSHFTMKASLGVPPASAPLLNSPIMKSSRLAFNDAHRRWSLGSKIGRATSELQSHLNLVCRLLLEKKKTIRSA